MTLPDTTWIDPDGRFWRVVDRELITVPMKETEYEAKDRRKAGLSAPTISYVASRLVP